MTVLVRRRLIVVPIIGHSDGRYLLCKMPAHRGVFPGQWGLPGGGVEDDERIEDALRREVREDLTDGAIRCSTRSSRHSPGWRLPRWRPTT